MDGRRKEKKRKTCCPMTSIPIKEPSLMVKVLFHVSPASPEKENKRRDGEVLGEEKEK